MMRKPGLGFSSREIRPSMEYAGILSEGGAGGRPGCPNTGKEETTEAISCPTRSRTDEVCRTEQPDLKESGQRTYDHAINEFVDWYCSEHASLSIARLFFDIESTWNNGTSLRQRSTSDWRQSDVWRTK